jgi:hypothetical protein
MLWTLILSFTVGGWVNTGYSNPGLVSSSHSITVPNLPSKEICEKTGADHIKKYNSNYYRYYVGVYTCVEQGK